MKKAEPPRGSRKRPKAEPLSKTRARPAAQSSAKKTVPTAKKSQLSTGMRAKPRPVKKPAAAAKKPASPEAEVKLAKLIRPLARNIMARHRLFALLDREAGIPVVWISAPAGAGKTMLVSSYLEFAKIPSVWYQMDTGDDDPATFFHFLGRALQTVQSRARRPLPVYSQDFVRGLSEFARNYFDAFLGRLKPGTILVFDDCHEILESTSTFQILLEAIGRRPQGVRFFFISRNAPPPVFSRLQANREMFRMEWPDLRLSLDEFRALLAASGYDRIPQGALSFIYQRLDGWVAGLHLLLQSQGVKGNDPRVLPGDDPETVFAYFAAEIFDQVEEKVREVVMRLAFLPLMTEKMAMDLSGDPDVKNLLLRLSQGNHFTERHGFSPTIFRFHPMFREFLLRRAEERLPEQEVRQLKRSAANILMDSGYPDDATRLLHETGDWSSLQQLLIRNAETLVKQGRTQSFLQWLEALPDRMVRASPWLLYWRGVCLREVDPVRADTAFSRAFELFASRKTDEGIFLAWIGSMESTISGWHNFMSLDGPIRWMDGFVKAGGLFPSVQIEDRVTSLMLMGCVIRQPEGVDLEFWCDKALKVARCSEDVNLRVGAMMALVNHGLWRGETTLVRGIRDSLQILLEREEIAIRLRMMLYWVEMILELWSGPFSPERALLVVDDAIAAAEKTGAHLWDHMYFSYGVQSSLALKDDARAMAYMARFERTVSDSRRFGVCLLHYLKGLIGYSEGNLGEARQHAEASMDLADEVGHVFTALQRRQFLGQLLIDAGDLESARRILVSGHLRAVQLGSLALQYAFLLSLACLCIREGRTDETRECLKEAIGLSRRHGFMMPLLWWHPKCLVEVFRVALEAGIDREQVALIIRNCGLEPDDPEACPETWPWPVKLYTLGRFELVCEGQEGRSGRAKQRPLDLLRVLICFGGRNVPAHALADALWPEADGDTQHQSFTITLHRLRQLVGTGDAIEFHEGRLSLNPKICWVDAWSFERCVAEALQNWKDRPAWACERAMRALDMYRGEFLADQLEERWTIRMRERLKDRFLVLIRELGSYLENQARYDEAVRYYRNAIEVDPLIEEFHQRMIRCYLGMGLESEAVHAYRSCCGLLKRGLGVRPSAKTSGLLAGILVPPENA